MPRKPVNVPDCNKDSKGNVPNHIWIELEKGEKCGRCGVTVIVTKQKTPLRRKVDWDLGGMIEAED